MDDVAGRSLRFGVAVEDRARGSAAADQALAEVARAAALGCDHVELRLGWARVAPSAGEVDEVALGRCARLASECRALGLEPVAVLDHRAVPPWVTPPFWAALDAPELYSSWVRAAAERLAHECRTWVTLDGINRTIVDLFAIGTGPSGRPLALRSLVRALDHALTAHVRAYQAIHDRVPGACVALGLAPYASYELLALLVDLLVAPVHTSFDGLGAFLDGRRRRWLGPRGGRTGVVGRMAHSVLPAEQALPRAATTVFRSGRPRLLDAVRLLHGTGTFSRRRRGAHAGPLLPAISAVGNAGLRVDLVATVASCDEVREVVAAALAARRAGHDVQAVTACAPGTATPAPATDALEGCYREVLAELAASAT